MFRCREGRFGMGRCLDAQQRRNVNLAWGPINTTYSRHFPDTLSLSLPSTGIAALLLNSYICYAAIPLPLYDQTPLLAEHTDERHSAQPRGPFSRLSPHNPEVIRGSTHFCLLSHRRRFSPLLSLSRIQMVTATRPCSGNIWWRCKGLNARSRCPPKGHGMCLSGIISVASALVSRDADDDAQDMVGLSKVY